ncbi:hypothetical protein F5Y17DRAFT_286090 [Xylariaceae sp. FL0594]|nr:hypothetical protein F5Y17DRAFT_286090 [Xylariaceae sp. FL0594]
MSVDKDNYLVLIIKVYAICGVVSHLGPFVVQSLVRLPLITSSPDALLLICAVISSFPLSIDWLRVARLAGESGVKLPGPGFARYARISRSSEATDLWLSRA